MQEKQKNIVIAIDGFSSCGKSTMAKWLARTLGFVYVDTGAMFRAVTLFSMQEGLWQGSVLDEKALAQSIESIQISFQKEENGDLHTLLNGVDVEKEIRSIEVSNKVSPISTLDFVRKYLLSLQQNMGKEVSVVMDGRDIGTTVFPNADLKIFLTASAQVRAERRFLELQEKGMEVSKDRILSNILERDRIDSTREISPLRKANDAVEIDNSTLSIEEQNNWVLRLVKERGLCNS